MPYVPTNSYEFLLDGPEVWIEAKAMFKFVLKARTVDLAVRKNRTMLHTEWNAIHQALMSDQRLPVTPQTRKFYANTTIDGWQNVETQMASFFTARGTGRGTDSSARQSTDDAAASISSDALLNFLNLLQTVQAMIMKKDGFIDTITLDQNLHWAP